MRFSTLVFALLPLTVLATDGRPIGPSSCFTITQTNEAPCPTPTSCLRPACEAFITATQFCGCASIYSTAVCATGCPTGCAGTSILTVVQQTCPTPTPTPSSGSSSIYPTTSVHYGNTTTTITSITTLTTCPASCTCSGQTTTWTGPSGPSSCTAQACSVVLPGGPAMTVTGVTVVTTPTPTGSSKTSAPTNLQSVGAAGRMEAGLWAGLFGLLAFL